MLINLESNYLAFTLQRWEINYFEWFTEWQSLLIIEKHQFIERIVGNHIECELGGVRNKFLTPPLKLQR